MATPYLHSTSGRLILAAAAVFLAAGAAGVISSSLYAIGIGFPAGITLAFVAVGLGLEDYTRPTLFSIMVMPPALWGFYYLMEELKYGGGSTTLGYAFAFLALCSIGKAAFPGSAEE